MSYNYKNKGKQRTGTSKLRRHEQRRDSGVHFKSFSWAVYDSEIWIPWNNTEYSSKGSLRTRPRMEAAWCLYLSVLSRPLRVMLLKSLILFASLSVVTVAQSTVVPLEAWQTVLDHRNGRSPKLQVWKTSSNSRKQQWASYTLSLLSLSSQGMNYVRIRSLGKGRGATGFEQKADKASFAANPTETLSRMFTVGVKSQNAL